ncbi:MAG TPA: phage holin family protein [Longimicrobiales bacterium]|nr:phage holin family protein [Longimicrobiales bacterium]
MANREQFERGNGEPALGRDPYPSVPYEPRGYDGPRYEAGHGPAGDPRHDDGPDLKTLVSSLGRDASQLAHDEMTLAKLELRKVADTLSSDLRTASRTLVKDLTKVGVALTLAMLAGLALTAAAVIGIGVLVGAYWAGGLIVGVVLLIAAAMLGKSAGSDLSDSGSLRLEDTRRVAQQKKDVLQDEVKETKRFAAEEAREFKRHASPGRTSTQTRH